MRLLHSTAHEGKDEEPDPLNDATWLYSYADMVTQLLLFTILTVTTVGLKNFSVPGSAAPPTLTHPGLLDTAKRLNDYVRDQGLQDLMKIDRGADRLTIRLRSLLLFDPGEAQLSVRAQEVLGDIAALVEVVDRSIRVEGHTDDVPIKTARFPSNWELSTARAIAVVQALEARGIARDHLAAAGYGEFHPIVRNNSDENRALNRRVEIVLLGE